MSAQDDASALVKKIKRGMDGNFHIGKLDPATAAAWDDVDWGNKVNSVQSSESTVTIETAEATNLYSLVFANSVLACIRYKLEDFAIS